MSDLNRYYPHQSIPGPNGTLGFSVPTFDIDLDNITQNTGVSAPLSVGRTGDYGWRPREKTVIVLVSGSIVGQAATINEAAGIVKTLEDDAEDNSMSTADWVGTVLEFAKTGLDYDLAKREIKYQSKYGRPSSSRVPAVSRTGIPMTGDGKMDWTTIGLISGGVLLCGALLLVALRK